LTASQDGTARVWDVQSGAELLAITHGGPVGDARWNTAEDRILTASADDTAKVWDAQSDQEVSTLSTYGQFVRWALWSPDENRIITASDDGRVRHFYPQPEAVITAACERGAVRNMTQSEWAQFMVDQPYQGTCANLSEEWE
jgi:WD40 repeat protein